VKPLTVLALALATAVVGCSSTLSAGSAPAPLNIKEQCYQNASKSFANCDFINQGNPEGLNECRKTKVMADNRCGRMAD
jgi:hypothetical protein